LPSKNVTNAYPSEAESSQKNANSPIAMLKSEGLDRADIASTEKELTTKLKAMQGLINGIHNGVDRASKLRADAVKSKFQKLTSVIVSLDQQKSTLFFENGKLKKEMQSLVSKLQSVEQRLKIEAKKAADKSLKAWFNGRADEITSFLEGSGLQHYNDKNFSPLTAGIVTYGIVFTPLLLMCVHISQNIKRLSTLNILLSINLFEVGYMAATICSMLLLLTTDPWHGIQHISRLNFVFIQIVIGALFWCSAVLIGVDLLRDRNRSKFFLLGFELAVRLGIASDYVSRVWLPVVERHDDPLSVPAHSYVVYFATSMLCAALTSRAQRLERISSSDDNGIPLSTSRLD
jgi:hypothetical protein